MGEHCVTPVNPNSNNPSTMSASNTQTPSISRPCSLPHHHHHRHHHRRHHHHHHHNLLFCHHHPNPCHHHHHHFSPNCPLHSYLFHPKSPPSLRPIFTFPSPPQNPEPAASVRSTNHPNLQIHGGASNTLMMQEENEELEEEYEEEPIFVLTDEWREFFAKSEAKRRLAKKEAKKKGKH